MYCKIHCCNLWRGSLSCGNNGSWTSEELLTHRVLALSLLFFSILFKETMNDTEMKMDRHNWQKYDKTSKQNGMFLVNSRTKGLQIQIWRSNFPLAQWRGHLLRNLSKVCLSISSKPTGIKKEKDNPGSSESYKKLYQIFRFFYFHLYNNVAVIYQRIYMYLIRINYVSLPSKCSCKCYVLYT